MTLFEYLRQNNLTRYAFAKRLEDEYHMSKSTVYKWISGQYPHPRNQQIIKQATSGKVTIFNGK